MTAAELRGADKPSLDEALGWVGSRVDDIYGAGVGRLDDVWIDPGTGAPRWLLVKEGRFGGRTTLIPFEDATAGAGHVWIPYERDVVRHAPVVAPGAPLTQQLENALRKHYAAAAPHRDEDPTTAATAQAAARRRSFDDLSAPQGDYRQLAGAADPAVHAHPPPAFGAPLHAAPAPGPRLVPAPGHQGQARAGGPAADQAPPAPGVAAQRAYPGPRPQPQVPQPRQDPQAPQRNPTPAPGYRSPYQPTHAPAGPAGVPQPAPGAQAAAAPPAPRPRVYGPPPTAPQAPDPEPSRRSAPEQWPGPSREPRFEPTRQHPPGGYSATPQEPESEPEPVAIPVVHGLDQPYRVELELTGGIKISGELTGFSLLPSRPRSG